MSFPPAQAQVRQTINSVNKFSEEIKRAMAAISCYSMENDSISVAYESKRLRTKLTTFHTSMNTLLEDNIKNLKATSAVNAGLKRKYEEEMSFNTSVTNMTLSPPERTEDVHVPSPSKQPKENYQ